MQKSASIQPRTSPPKVCKIYQNLSIKYFALFCKIVFTNFANLVDSRRRAAAENGRSVQAKAIAEQAKTAAAAAQATADEAVKAATANAEVPPLRSGI